MGLGEMKRAASAFNEYAPEIGHVTYASSTSDSSLSTSTSCSPRISYLLLDANALRGGMTGAES